MTTTAFQEYSRRKEGEALAAPLAGFATVSEEATGTDLLSFGNTWSRRLFDGDFYRSAGAVSPDLPAVSLVLSSFLVSGESRPGAGDPGGPGRTARHLVHEGLARVDADAVLGGMGSGSENHVCSVWHPELVRLRADRGLPRHPVQVLVTNSCDVPFDRCLLFREPALRVVVMTRSRMVPVARERLRYSPWVEVMDAGEPMDLPRALAQLRAEGIAVISAVGGRRVASSLLQTQLVTDLYVTTQAPASTAEAVAFYDGPPMLRRRLLAKTGRGAEAGIRFEHLAPPAAFTSGLRLDALQPGVLR